MKEYSISRLKDDKGYNRRNQEFMSSELQNVILLLNNYGYYTNINSVWETVVVFLKNHDVTIKEIKWLLNKYKIKVYGIYQQEAYAKNSQFSCKYVEIYIGSKEKPMESKYYLMNGIEPN